MQNLIDLLFYQSIKFPIRNIFKLIDYYEFRKNKH